MSLVGVRVVLTAFGADGWEDEVGLWAQTAEQDQGTLTEFMTKHLGIPKPEAEELAKDVLGPWLEEWETRDGEQARNIKRASRWFVGGAVLVVALALVGLVALGVLLIRWL